MPKFNWKTKSLAVTVVALLLVVGNPELRALRLIFDFFGADLLLLLLGCYLHSYCPPGMLFTPCKGGIRPSEDESITPSDAEAGVRVLADVAFELAGQA